MAVSDGLKRHVYKAPPHPVRDAPLLLVLARGPHLSSDSAPRVLEL